MRPLIGDFQTFIGDAQALSIDAHPLIVNVQYLIGDVQSIVYDVQLLMADVQYLIGVDRILFPPSGQLLRPQAFQVTDGNQTTQGAGCQCRSPPSAIGPAAPGQLARPLRLLLPHGQRLGQSGCSSSISNKI